MHTILWCESVRLMFMLILVLALSHYIFWRRIKDRPTEILCVSLCWRIECDWFPVLFCVFTTGIFHNSGLGKSWLTCLCHLIFSHCPGLQTIPYNDEIAEVNITAMCRTIRHHCTSEYFGTCWAHAALLDLRPCAKACHDIVSPWNLTPNIYWYRIVCGNAWEETLVIKTERDCRVIIFATFYFFARNKCPLEINQIKDIFISTEQ